MQNHNSSAASAAAGKEEDGKGDTRHALLDALGSMSKQSGLPALVNNIKEIELAFLNEDENAEELKEKFAQSLQRNCCTTCYHLSDDVLKRCARCKVAHYCSTECQAKDWSKHKQVCGEDCAICLAPLNERILDFCKQAKVLSISHTINKLKCGHQFHSMCFSSWIQNSNNLDEAKCPMCRKVETKFSTLIVPILKLSTDAALVQDFQRSLRVDVGFVNGCGHADPECRCNGRGFNARALRVRSEDRDKGVKLLKIRGFVREHHGFQFLLRETNAHGGVSLYSVPRPELMTGSITTFVPSTLRKQQGTVVWPDQDDNIEDCVHYYAEEDEKCGVYFAPNGKLSLMSAQEFNAKLRRESRMRTDHVSIHTAVCDMGRAQSLVFGDYFLFKQDWPFNRLATAACILGRPADKRPAVYGPCLLLDDEYAFKSADLEKLRAELSHVRILPKVRKQRELMPSPMPTFHVCKVQKK